MGKFILKMRFDFCGNTDCPEWALAEVQLLNRMSAVKLKLMLAQIVKKMCGQHYEYDKIAKLCRDQKFDIDETKVAMAVVEFLLSQSCKHQTSEKVFSKWVWPLRTLMLLSKPLLTKESTSTESRNKTPCAYLRFRGLTTRCPT